MTEVLLFHHAHGLTAGVREFAGALRAAGHTVHTPDLYDGRVFATLDEGLAHAGEVGFGALRERGVRAADDLPADVVHAGFSLGGMPAQQLAQTRPGRGALLLHSSAPPEAFGSPWPAHLPVQVHAMDADPFFVGEGDVEAARAIVAASTDGELFLYPGDAHLFTDSSLPGHDPDATALVLRRVLEFLARV
jgi:dienelactone hydrolase